MSTVAVLAFGFDLSPRALDKNEEDNDPRIIKHVASIYGLSTQENFDWTGEVMRELEKHLAKDGLELIRYDSDKYRCYAVVMSKSIVRAMGNKLGGVISLFNPEKDKRAHHMLRVLFGDLTHHPRTKNLMQRTAHSEPLYSLYAMEWS